MPCPTQRDWGGGSVFTATSGLRWEARHGLPENMELGTPPFLEIISIGHALKVTARVAPAPCPSVPPCL